MILKLVLGSIVILFSINSFGDPLQGYITDKDAFGCYEESLKRCFKIPLGMSIDLEGVNLSQRIVKMEGINSSEKFDNDWWVQSSFISNYLGFSQVDKSEFSVQNLSYDSGEWRYNLKVNGDKAIFEYGKSVKEVKLYAKDDLYGITEADSDSSSILVVYGDNGSCIKELVCVPNELCKVDVVEGKQLCPKSNVYSSKKVVIDPALGVN